MSQTVLNSLKYHPQILGILGYSANRAGKLTPQEIADALDVENIYIGSVTYRSSKQGQTSTLAQVWGKHIVFYYRPKNPGKRQKSLGYYLNRTGRPPRRVFKYDINNPPNAKGIIVQDDYQFKLIDVNCGYLVEDAVS
jgi:hypothetical protein